MSTELRKKQTIHRVCNCSCLAFIRPIFVIHIFIREKHELVCISQGREGFNFTFSMKEKTRTFGTINFQS